MTATIVVGVDGSPASEAALAWAKEEALARDATLRIVHAWSVPYAGEVAGMAVALAEEESLLAGAQAVLDAAVERATGADGPRVVATLARGDPARVLLDHAEGAELLVVGSRGRGGFAGLLLGSVSQQCAHHAACPVVVVPSRPGA